MNQLVPSISIELGGQTRSLRFDFNALAAYEAATGKNSLDPLIWGDQSAANIRALLWATLLHAEPGLNLADVGAWMHFGNVQQIADSLQKAFTAAAPEAAGDPLP